MAETLKQDIVGTGINQGDLVKLLTNIMNVVNELQTDHATFKTALDNQITTLANVKSIYDAHVHTADGNASRTSAPDSGTPTGSPSVASAITNTAGVAPATLTNATAVKMTAG